MNTQKWANTDYYAVLQVTRDASDSEIKKAYRKLARSYHPDTNSSPDAVETFKMVAEAYETLRDPIMRRHYDLAVSFGGRNQFDLLDATLQNLFSGVFKIDPTLNPFETNSVLRGRDIELVVMISASEATEGTTVAIPGGTQTIPTPIRVKIPQGVSDGQRIRLRGLGDTPAGVGENGDLYMKVSVVPDGHTTPAANPADPSARVRT